MGSVYLYLISFDFFYFLFQYEIFKHLLLGKEKTTKILILKQKYLEHSNRVLFSEFGKSAQFLVWIFFFPTFFCLGACGLVLWTLVWIFIRLYYSALIVTEDNLMLFLFMREGVMMIIMVLLILLFRLYLVDLLPLFLIN